MREFENTDRFYLRRTDEWLTLDDLIWRFFMYESQEKNLITTSNIYNTILENNIEHVKMC
jgi:hypothetical protein